MTKTTISISREVREALGKMRSNSRETYDMLLRRKLMKKKVQGFVNRIYNSPCGKNARKELAVRK